MNSAPDRRTKRDAVDGARIADGIGQRWEVLNNAYKPYPCGVVLFPVIDACLEGGYDASGWETLRDVSSVGH